MTARPVAASPAYDALSAWRCRDCDRTGSARPMLTHERHTGHWLVCPPVDPTCHCGACAMLREKYGSAR